MSVYLYVCGVFSNFFIALRFQKIKCKVFAYFYEAVISTKSKNSFQYLSSEKRLLH
jgi:hypothetical protein